MKKIIFFLFGFISSVSVFGQDAVQKTFWEDPLHHPMTPFYAVIFFIFVILILILVVAIIMIRVLNMMIEHNARERAKAAGVAYVPSQTLWERVSQKLNDSVPIEKEEDIDLGHNFDGIRELDNHLPPWWKWLFYGTIAWAVVYIIAYHFTASLPLSIEEYQQEVAAADMARQKLLATQPQAVIDVEKLQYSEDAEIISNGQKIFSSNCVACHRADGGGNTIGPNLTDEYWLHGGSIKDIYQTVNNGFVEKGMPAWGKALSPSELRDVTFFVLSIQGSNPPDAKVPQGELYQKQEVAQPDSLKAQAGL